MFLPFFLLLGYVKVVVHQVFFVNKDGKWSHFPPFFFTFPLLAMHIDCDLHLDEFMKDQMKKILNCSHMVTALAGQPL